MAGSRARHHGGAALGALCHRGTLPMAAPLGTSRSTCNGGAHTPGCLCVHHKWEAVTLGITFLTGTRPATRDDAVRTPGSLHKHPMQCKQTNLEKGRRAGRLQEKVLYEYISQWAARRPARPLEQGARAGCPHSGVTWMDVRVAWNGGWHRRPPPRDYSQPPVGWGRLDPCARAGKTRSTGSSSSDGPWKKGARH